MGGAGEFSGALNPRRPSTAGSQGSSRGPYVEHQGKKDRAGAALDLWNKWATTALGPLSSQPTNDELSKRSKRIQNVLKESEKISSTVSKRIAGMADVRAELNVMSESSTSVASRSPSKNARNAVLASRAAARSSMNEFVREEGKREAAAAASEDPYASPQGSPRSRRPQTAPSHLSLPEKSPDIALSQQLESMRASVRAAERETAAQLDEKEELLGTIDLLRAKLHSQDSREIENQRRLQVYERLDPIFNRLAEKFQFKSADEVIDRLEFLENDKLNTYDQLLEAQSEIKRLEKHLRDAREQQATLQQTMENTYQAKMSKLQKQVQESRSEVETLGMELRANAARQEVSQRLSNSVINLWNKMHDNSEVMKQRPLTSDDIPVTEPLHMVQCIYELMTMHSVSATGILMRDLSQVCNRIWNRFFSDKLDIKGDTYQIVSSLEELSNIMDNKLKRQASTMKAQASTARLQGEENAKLMRDVRARDSDLSRRDDLMRQSVRLTRERAPLTGTTCPTCHDVVGRPGQTASGISSRTTTATGHESRRASLGLDSSVDAKSRLQVSNSSRGTPTRPWSCASGRVKTGQSVMGNPNSRASTAASRSVDSRPMGAHWNAITKAGMSGSINFSEESENLATKAEASVAYLHSDDSQPVSGLSVVVSRQQHGITTDKSRLGVTARC